MQPRSATVHMEYADWYVNDCERLAKEAARLEFVASMYGVEDDDYQRDLTTLLRQMVDQMDEFKELIGEALEQGKDEVAA